MEFEPGTNWGYSHTNYVILGRVLEQIAGMPLADAIRKYVLEPMGLKQTGALTTPEIPQPVLHAFSSERRETAWASSRACRSMRRQRFGIRRGRLSRAPSRRPT